MARPVTYCTMGGCSKRHFGRGYCSMHWNRWKRNGDPLIRKRRANGEGGIENGYRYITVNGRWMSKHLHIWEQHFGKVPEGYVIHHKNGDKLDNRMENLEQLSRADHATLHADRYRKSKGNTETHKRCCRCKEMIARTDFSPSKQHIDGLFPRCKVCNANHVRKYKHLKIAKRLWPDVSETGPWTGEPVRRPRIAESAS